MSAAADTDGSGFKSQGAHSNSQNGTQVPGPSDKPVRGSAGIEGWNSIDAGLEPICLYPIGPF